METKCRICEKEFNSSNHLSRHVKKDHNLSNKEYYDKYLKTNPKEGICLACGNPTVFEGFGRGYHKYCSTKCTSNSPEVLEKKNQTRHTEKVVTEQSLDIECQICYKKLVSSIALSQHLVKGHKELSIREYYDRYLKQKSDEGICPECKKETKFMGLGGYQKHCGLKCSQKSEGRLEKFNQTLIDNNSLEKAKEKRTLTNLEKFGKEVVNQYNTEETKLVSLEKVRIKEEFKFKEFLKYYNIEIISQYTKDNEKVIFHCLKCRKKFEDTPDHVKARHNKCSCSKTEKSSVGQMEVLEFIKSIDSCEIKYNDKTLIHPRELDIYIPSKNIAIEYCGLYWHSELIVPDRCYHLKKLEECNKLATKLIQIFEDEWMYKKEICKSRLKQILQISEAVRINGRDCIIREIDSISKSKFLDKFHIQGSDSSIIKLGAFFKDSIVSVMTFSHGNISRKIVNSETWELSRFCSDHQYHIPGIAGKLLEYFKRNYLWKEIFTFADRRWSDGNLYYKLGFKLDKITKPNYWYSKDGYHRIHRFEKRKTSSDPKDISEWTLRLREGYYKIWDCGHLKFTIKKE